MQKASKAAGVLSEWIESLIKFKQMMAENEELFKQNQELREVEKEMEKDMEKLEDLEREEQEYKNQMTQFQGQIG